MSRPTRVLVVYWHDDAQPMRVAVEQHLRALELAEGVDVRYVNAAYDLPLEARTRAIDAIVLHNTVLCMRWSPFFFTFKRRLDVIRDHPAVKIALPQDEYDHAEVLEEWLLELGVTHVFSNFGPQQRRALYANTASTFRFSHALTGYLDATATAPAAARDHRDRPLDVVYRATHLPYWFGSHGQLKHRVGTVVDEAARRHGLRCDVSTRPEDVIVGPAWTRFLASGRVVVGCESGSSVLDRRGEIRARIAAMLAVEPDLSFDEVDRRMPEGWDDWRFFAISPRHFEAIITRTCQVLVRGRYDGVLTAGEHYIPLEPDFANLDEVVAQIADVERCAAIADRAYEAVVGSGRYAYPVFAERLAEACRQGRPGDDGLLARALFARLPVRPARRERPARLERLRDRLPALPPPGGLARGRRAVGTVVGDPVVAHVLRWWLRDRDAAVGLDELLRDLVRLSVLGQGSVPLAVELDGATLTFRTLAYGALAPSAPEPSALAEALRAGEVTSIVWDHTGVERPVPFASPLGRGALEFDADWRYRFTATASLAPRCEEAVTAVLRVAVGAAGATARAA